LEIAPAAGASLARHAPMLLALLSIGF